VGQVLNLAIEKPVSKELGELVRGYYTMMRVLGFDLGLRAQRVLSPSRGVGWFPSFIAGRKQSDPKHFPSTHTFEYRDPAFILKNYAHDVDSPYREVFGYTEEMGRTAKKINWARNAWSHFGQDPTLEDLVELTQHVREFAQEADLESLGAYVTLLSRLKRIKTGQYQPTAEENRQTSEPPTESKVIEPTLEPDSSTDLVVPDDAPRPRIGGIWNGAIPDARFKITKTGDIVDPHTFESLSARAGDDFARKVKQWLAVPPRGNEVWVAEDGAIGGWINEYPRLLGYVGTDPADDFPRGFYLPEYYEAHGEVVVDLESGAELESGVAASVEPGTLLRVTTYGDVVIIDDANGIVRLATVTPAEWFSGHLG